MIIRTLTDTHIERPVVAVDDFCHFVVADNNGCAPYLWDTVAVCKYKYFSLGVYHGLPIGGYRFEPLVAADCYPSILTTEFDPFGIAYVLVLSARVDLKNVLHFKPYPAQ